MKPILDNRIKIRRILQRLKLFLASKPHEEIFLATHQDILKKTFKMFYKKRRPQQVPISATVRKIYLKKAELYLDLKTKNTPFFIIKKKLRKLTKKFERIMLNYQAAVAALTKEPYVYPVTPQRIKKNLERNFVKKNTKFLLFFGKKFLKRKVISFLTQLKAHLKKKKSRKNLKQAKNKKNPKQKIKTFLQNVFYHRNYVPQNYEH